MADAPASQTAHVPQETAKAAQAFADYVALGPSRSIRNLHADYLNRQQTANKPPTVRYVTLGEWSSKFHWQQRVRQAASEQARQKLEEAEELDADTFLESSRLLNERMHSPSPINTDVVIKVRETVRKPSVKTNTTDVNVTHSGTVKHAHHDMSSFTDDEIERLAEIAERRKAEAR